MSVASIACVIFITSAMFNTFGTKFIIEKINILYGKTVPVVKFCDILGVLCDRKFEIFTENQDR